MNTGRRLFIKGSLIAITAAATGVFSLLKPLVAFAAKNRKAFSAETEADALAAFFPGEGIAASDAIAIGVHDVVENGAVVPVEIRTTLPAVESITILAEKNPNPLIASFNLGPECSGFIATRIKVAEPSDIVAVVRSSGKLFSARKFVEVVAGGCG
jgi:sulfur-oxidizing protein SoxY